MLQKNSIVRITFSDTGTTLLQKQQLNVIQPSSYKKLSTRFSDFHQILRKW